MSQRWQFSIANVSETTSKLRSGRNNSERRAGCDSQGGETQKNLEQATHYFQPLSVLLAQIAQWAAKKNRFARVDFAQCLHRYTVGSKLNFRGSDIRVSSMMV